MDWNLVGYFSWLANNIVLDKGGKTTFVFGIVIAALDNMFPFTDIEKATLFFFYILLKSIFYICFSAMTFSYFHDKYKKYKEKC